MIQILGLNMAGAPIGWLGMEEAIIYYSLNKVAAELGVNEFVFRGGYDSNGQRSEIRASSIIMVRGARQGDDFGFIPLSNQALFARDRNMCAYCGFVFRTGDLTRDHVRPVSRGGPDQWENVVTACKRCNHDLKRDMTPEQAGMPLLYTPYKPNRAEHILLTGRHVLADQMEYLLCGIPQHSRLHG